MTYPKTENCPSSNDSPPNPAYKNAKQFFSVHYSKEKLQFIEKYMLERR